MEKHLQKALESCYKTIQPNPACSLRDYSTEPALLRLWIEQALQHIPAANDPLDCYELHTHLGTVFRIVNHPMEAIPHLQTALEATHTLADKRKEQLAYLRIAEAYKYAGDKRAYTFFLQSFALAHKNKGYSMDFIYQHLGKWHLEEEEFKKAIVLFESALNIRLRKNDSDLIASSRTALQFAQTKLERAQNC